MSKIYTTGQLTSFVEKVFGSSRLSGNGQDISVVCPLCKAKKSETYSKKKLVIRVSDGLSHCWVCDYSSKNLVHLVKTVNPSYLKEYISTFLNSDQISSHEYSSSHQTQLQQEQELKLPDGFKLLALETDEASWHVKSLQKYLKTRLSNYERDVWYWKLGYCDFSVKEYRNRIIIPSFDSEGKMNYFTGRHIKGYNPKYRNPDVPRENVVFNEINIDWTKELTLVEGPFDLVKCNDNATCVLGSSLNQDFVLFQKIVSHGTPVLLAYDPDAIHKALELAKTFSEYGIETRVMIFPEGSKAKDVGDLSRSQFNKLSSSARLYTRNFDFKTRLNMIV